MGMYNTSLNNIILAREKMIRDEAAMIIEEGCRRQFSALSPHASG